MNWSTALAKPSSSWDVVTCVACRCTSSFALPMAMLRPLGLNIGTSLGWSPIVAMAVHRDFQVSRQPLDDAAFVGRGVRHVKVVRLRPRGGDLRAERFLKRRFTRGDFVVVVADADDLDDAPDVSTPSKVGHHDRLGLDGGCLAIDARGLCGNGRTSRSRCRSRRRGRGPRWPRRSRAPRSRAARRSSRTDRSGSTITPPLNAAIGIVRRSGSTSIRRPRGGRPLQMVKTIPRSRNRLTAWIARSVSTLSFVTIVPSMSASTAEIG